MKLPTPWRAFTIVTASALMFTACSTDTPETTEDASLEAQDELRIGAVPGWSDHTGIAYIYEHVLEENGYEVEVASTVDVGPAYAAVADGDLDLYLNQLVHKLVLNYYLSLNMTQLMCFH